MLLWGTDRRVLSGWRLGTTNRLSAICDACDISGFGFIPGSTPKPLPIHSRRAKRAHGAHSLPSETQDRVADVPPLQCILLPTARAQSTPYKPSR